MGNRYDDHIEELTPAQWQARLRTRATVLESTVPRLVQQDDKARSSGERCEPAAPKSRPERPAKCNGIVSRRELELLVSCDRFPGEVLTVTQAAGRIGCHPLTVYLAVMSGAPIKGFVLTRGQW